jgi:hypothetical protein
MKSSMVLSLPEPNLLTSKRCWFHYPVEKDKP